MKLCRDCCGSFYSKQQMSQNIDKKKRAETPKYHQNLRLSSVTSLKGADEEKVMKKFKENSKQSPSRLPSIQFNNAELNNNLRTLISDSGVIRRSKIIRTKSIEGGRKRILNRSFSVLYGDENKMYSTDLLRSVHEDLQTFLQDLQRKTEQSRKLLLQQQQLNQRKNSKDFIGIFMNSVVLHLMNWLKIEKKIIQDVNNNRNMSSAMSTDSIFIISLLVLICAIVVICSSFNDLQHLFYLITSSFYFIENCQTPELFEVNSRKTYKEMLAMLLFIIQFMSGLVVIKTEFNIDYPYGLAHECQSEALGLSDGRIKDWQISASSTAVEDNISTRLARLASVKAGEAWCAGYSEREEWLQIDLGIASKVTAIATQGRSNNNDWITAFRVSYSLDFIKWNNIRNDDNSNKIFNGNLNSFNIRMIYLPHEIFTRFLRIHIIRWNGKPCLRLEVYGCQECNRDLSDPGVASFSASSEKTFYDEPLCHANNAAITSSDGWCAATFESFSDIFNDLSSLSHLRKRARQLRFQRLNARQKARFTRRLKRYRYLQKRVSRIRRNIQPEEEKRLIKSEQEPKPWLQIDLNYYKLITAIQTKGRSNKGVNEWVKQYKLAYSNDSYVWTYYREGNLLTPRFFRANNDNDSLRINYLNKPFVARYIRFIPTRAHNHVSMRAGVIGCQLKRKVCEENFFRFSESFNCIPEIKYIRPNNSFSHPLLNDDCIRPIILSLKSSDQFLKPKFNSDQNSLYNLIDLNSNYNNNQKSFRLTAKWAAELSQMESIAGVQFNITTKSLPFQWRSVNLKLNKISVYVTRHVNYVDSSLLPKRNRRYANRHVLCAKRLNINISYEKKFRLMETKKLLMQCRRNNLIGGMIVFVGHFNINIQTVTPSKSINRGQIAKVIPTLCDVHIF